MRFRVFIFVAVALFAATPLAGAVAHPYPVSGNATEGLHALDGFDWH